MAYKQVPLMYNSRCLALHPTTPLSGRVEHDSALFSARCNQLEGPGFEKEGNIELQ
jgi:hypothetical protein